MPPSQPREIETAEPDRLEALERLANLRASGALTDEEFGAEKSKLLAEQEQFDVILESEGRRPSEVTKKIRNLTGLSLWQAVELVGSAPQPLYKQVDKDTAFKAKAELEAAGATVLVKLASIPGAAQLMGMRHDHRLTGRSAGRGEPHRAGRVTVEFTRQAGGAAAGAKRVAARRRTAVANADFLAVAKLASAIFAQLGAICQARGTLYVPPRSVRRRLQYELNRQRTSDLERAAPRGGTITYWLHHSPEFLAMLTALQRAAIRCRARVPTFGMPRWGVPASGNEFDAQVLSGSSSKSPDRAPGPHRFPFFDVCAGDDNHDGCCSPLLAETGIVAYLRFPLAGAVVYAQDMHDGTDDGEEHSTATLKRRG